MQTHPDYDADRLNKIFKGLFSKKEDSNKKSAIGSLEKRALKAREENSAPITMPVGEEPIYEKCVDLGGGRLLTVVKREDDPDCLRVSMGSVPGNPECDYFVFRGDQREILDLMRRSLRVIAHLDSKGEL